MMAIDILQPATFDINIERGTSYDPLVFVCYSSGRVIDISAYTPHAQVRAVATTAIVLDLLPVIIDGPGGKVQVGPFTSTQTLTFPLLNGVWSLLLEDSFGNWMPEIVAGAFVVTDAVTRDEP